MDSCDVRIRIEIDNGISKKGNHILGHHPQQKYQSLPPEICVEKLQRDVQKYAL
jgi:hypothetical protein